MRTEDEYRALELQMMRWKIRYHQLYMAYLRHEAELPEHIHAEILAAIKAGTGDVPMTSEQFLGLHFAEPVL